MSQKIPSSKYNPHLSPEEVKKHSINIKFTAAEFAEIMEVVEFSGQKRMNMCCTGVMKYVRELKAQMEEASKKPVTRRNIPEGELRETILSLRNEKMSVGDIAHRLKIPQKRVLEILATE